MEGTSTQDEGEKRVLRAPCKECKKVGVVFNIAFIKQVILELETTVQERDSEIKLLQEQISTLRTAALQSDRGAMIQEQADTIAKLQKRLAERDGQLARLDSILKTLQFYKCFGEQQSHFVEYVEEMKRLEALNEKLVLRVQDLRQGTLLNPSNKLKRPQVSSSASSGALPVTGAKKMPQIRLSINKAAQSRRSHEPDNVAKLVLLAGELTNIMSELETLLQNSTLRQAAESPDRTALSAQVEQALEMLKALAETPTEQVPEADDDSFSDSGLNSDLSLKEQRVSRKPR